MGIKKIVYASIFIALGVILPMVFHLFGPGLGSIFLPMHIPVFLAGVVVGPVGGLFVGMITPVISSLLTGMPPLIPMVPIMLVELGLYGLTIGYFYNIKELNIYFSLLASMVLGRGGVGIVVWILFNLFNMTNLAANPLLFIWGAVVKGVPGIAAQLIVIPLVVNYLKDYQEDMVVKENV